MRKTENVEFSTITVRTVDGTTMTGKVNLSRAYDRVSDLFTSDEKPFIVLVDAVTKEGAEKTLFINKQFIVWVEPHDQWPDE